MRYILPIVLILSGLLSGCARSSKEGTALEAIERSGAVPGSVKTLVRAVAQDDSTGFASLINYPLERPYPLRDIENSDEMKSYYRTLVDDSLRNIIVSSRPEKWDEFGWRGWSLDEGQYLWLDSLIYAVPYTSSLEAKELATVRQREINTLEPSLRQGWEPVTSLQGDDGRVMRIDAKEGMDRTESGSLRLAIYDKNGDRSALPAMMLSGNLDPEGSALTPIYLFADDKGNTALWNAEPSDNEPSTLLIKGKEGKIQTIPVHKIYWLEEK